MSDSHPGFDDHHQLKRHAQKPLDPHKPADRKIMDTVWDIAQGKAPTVQDDPDTVTVPEEYTNAVLFCAAKALTRAGLTKNITLDIVTNDDGEPLLQIMRKMPIADANGKDAHVLITRLGVAFTGNMDPAIVGRDAAAEFTQRLDAVLNNQN